MTNQNIVLPSIALRGTTILPGMIVHFDVSRERSIKAIEAAMLHDQKIFLVTQKDPEVETPDASGVYQVGTIAYIKLVVKLPQNLLRVLVEGIGRGLLVKFEQEFPFLRSEITPVDEESIQMPEALMEAMHRSLKELFHRYCMENGKISKDFRVQPEAEDLYDYVRLEDMDAYNKAAGLKRIKVISADGPSDYMRPVLNAMDEATFEAFIRYHLTICERPELVGAGSHTVDILSK